MPTARELLEQADALMRRNRMGAGGNATARPATPGTNPPTVSPTSGPTSLPRTIQLEPIAPSVARTSLPVDPTESPALAARAPSDQPTPPRALTAPASEPESDGEAEFPLLTDAVDEAKAAADAPLDDLADDVPVLTDAVEEIDVGIVDEPARDEPSIWELTVRGETSVLGPAPDSIVVVPLPEAVPPAVPQAPPEGRDPLGLDQPPAGYAPSDATSVAETEPDDRAGAMSLAEDPWNADGESGDLAQSQTPEIEATEPLAVPSTAKAWTDDSQPLAMDEPEPVASVPLADSALGVADEDAVAADPSPAEARAGPLAESAPAEPRSQPLAPASESEQQRIREIAEEIGMQVMQRIDIFSDTALRAQLGERLRPVVDRAAADLVAAINEHVGELLRAYISEAIEREIESWRSRGR